MAERTRLVGSAQARSSLASATPNWLSDPLDDLDSHERSFLAASTGGALDSCCQHVVAALRLIWESGRAFARFSPWLNRADQLLRDSRSGETQRLTVGIFLVNAIVLEGKDIGRALSYLPFLHALRDNAQSIELAELAAAAEAPLLCMCGEQSAADACVHAIDPGYADTARPAPSTMCLAAAEAFVCSVGEKPPARIRLLEALTGPVADGYPMHLRLTGLTHLMLWAACLGDSSAIERVASVLRSLAMSPEQVFHAGYLAYALGVAELRAGWSSAALVHAEQTLHAAVVSECGTLGVFARLLRAQALADTGQLDEAMAAFADCCTVAAASGHVAIQRSAQCELARLYPDAPTATNCLGPRPHDHRHRPDQPPCRIWHRGGLPTYSGGVSTNSASRAPAPQPGHPLRVRMLGGFSLSVSSGHSLIELNLKGRRPAELLMHLVAQGGSNVSIGRLSDALWPEMDGANARQNIKALVWRLRQMVETALNRPVDWLTLRNGRLSLSMDQCSVDALEFLNASSGPIQTQDQALEILALYCGDFLPAEDTTPIEHFRKQLRGRFVAVTALGVRKALNRSVPLPSEWADLLMRARAMDPESDLIHLLLMELHLRMGQPVMALTDHLAAEQQLDGRISQRTALELTSLREQASRQLRALGTVETDRA